MGLRERWREIRARHRVQRYCRHPVLFHESDLIEDGSNRMWWCGICRKHLGFDWSLTHHGEYDPSLYPQGVDAV